MLVPDAPSNSRGIVLVAPSHLRGELGRRPTCAPSDLLHEFRGRLHSLEAIASVVNSDLDLSRILQTIVDAICQHTAWSLGGIMAIDESLGYSVLMARHDPGRKTCPLGAPDRWPLSADPSPVVVAPAPPDRHLERPGA